MLHFLKRHLPTVFIRPRTIFKIAIIKTKGESNAFFLFSWWFRGVADHQMTPRLPYFVLFYLSSSSSWSLYSNIKNPHFGKRMQKFLSVCQDRQFTDNVWLHNVRGQFRLNFHCLKKVIDVWAADVKSTVAFKDSHLTDGYTDCSPWFRPLKSLQSSTTSAAFSRKVSNKNLSYSWSYPPLNRNYKMIFVSQQFLIFKKYNSQETIFILELTWLKKHMGILQLRYEMYCQFINFPISFNKKRKQQQKK